MPVLVTGATGFIGRNVLAFLHQNGLAAREAVRTIPSGASKGSDRCVIGDLATGGEWREAVQGIETIIHLAGRAHILKQEGAQACRMLYKINMLATQRLAEEAVAAGVRRIVFVSTIAVHDVHTDGRLTESQPLKARDDYGKSKLLAEETLRSIECSSGLEVVIVRPPLVYGPDAPGNIYRLSRLIATGLPLPVPSKENVRSLIGVENLASFLVACTTHPAAAGETFLISDSEDVSTAQIVHYLAEGMGKKAWLVPFPAPALKTVASIFGAGGLYDKMYSSLQVDPSKAINLLGWSPQKSVREGLRETGQAFIKKRKSHQG
jgi:nucleoside-diphosphate-sugar epimerase